MNEFLISRSAINIIYYISIGMSMKGLRRNDDTMKN